MAGVLETIHATSRSVGGRAVLIRGPSGAGKSDLALRCLGMPVSQLVPVTPLLVADDRVCLSAVGGRLKASAPSAIRGKLEVRGLGIITLEATEPEADVVLVADIVTDRSIARFPIAWPTTTLSGFVIPTLAVQAFEGATPLKLIMALTMTALPEVRQDS